MSGMELYKSSWFILLFLAGCAAPVKAPLVVSVPEAPEEIEAGGQLYLVDNQSSQVIVEVGKTGSQSFLGHNHLLLIPELEGSVHLFDPIDKSRISIRVPVGTIVVDPVELRQKWGEKYKKSIGNKDKQATYNNMLSSKVLDSQNYSHLSLESAQITGTETGLIMTTRIKIRDQIRMLDIPLELELADKYLCVNGRFSVLQTDFGITPFSVFMGALSVEDEVKIDFSVCANLQESNAG